MITKKERQIEKMVDTMNKKCDGDYWHLGECRDKGCDQCKVEKLLKAGYKNIEGRHNSNCAPM